MHRGQNSPLGSDLMTFWNAWTSRVAATRGLKVAAIVGTALLAINHGDAVLNGTYPAVWKIALTYLVSTYSSAMLLR